MTPAREFTVAVTRSIASQARSRLLTLTLYISQLPSPRNRAMAGWSDGYRADLVRRRLTPELISSLPGTAGLPPFISFSTSYPELRNFWDATETPGFVRQCRQIISPKPPPSRTAKIFPRLD